MPFRASHLVWGVAAVCSAGLMLLGSGCGTSLPASPAGGSIVQVTERDFDISLPHRVPAGTVVLRVHNEGPDNHELIVVRLGKRPIPVRADGMTVNEEALAPSIVGQLEPGAPGSIRLLRLELTPGRYEVMCNMEGHFMGGMHDQFVAVA
jgi:hypothetical protein